MDLELVGRNCLGRVACYDVFQICQVLVGSWYGDKHREVGFTGLGQLPLDGGN
jgi:hypothetical protein